MGKWEEIMEKIPNYTLGIDMGTNSIGWAVVEHDDNLQPTDLIACGTRIFQEAVDAKSRIPKNSGTPRRTCCT